MAATLTIRIPPATRKLLSQMSREEKVPVSTIVRRSLERELFRQRMNRIRERLEPLARAAGYFTEEDILKIKS